MYLFFFTILVGFFLDLLTKKLAFDFFKQKINIFSDFIFFKYTENTGIAFSIPLEGLLLKVITFVLIFAIIYYFFKFEYKKNNKLLNFSFGLILAGALANGYERIFNSKVIDFIGVKYFSIFNLADSFITIGAIIYLYISFLNNNKKLGL